MSLTKKQIEILRQLTDEGYAVVLITPAELEGASARKVEERLIELSWEIIDDLKPEGDEHERY